MAAQPWKFYNLAKKKIGNNTIKLDTDVFNMSLYRGSSNASTQTLSLLGQVTNEITAQGGYSAGGKSLTGLIWTMSGSVARWDATDKVFTASGASLVNIKFAVIHRSLAATSGHLLCWSRLSTSPFSVTPGNTLTIQFATGGIFTLT